MCEWRQLSFLNSVLAGAAGQRSAHLQWGSARTCRGALPFNPLPCAPTAVCRTINCMFTRLTLVRVSCFYSLLLLLLLLRRPFKRALRLLRSSACATASSLVLLRCGRQPATCPAQLTSRPAHTAVHSGASNSRWAAKHVTFGHV
jgi:hypothetical protein